MIEFLGNEAVAIYRIRVGRNIGSAALVADGVDPRIDGFTSPALARVRYRDRAGGLT